MSEVFDSVWTCVSLGKIIPIMSSTFLWRSVISLNRLHVRGLSEHQEWGGPISVAWGAATGAVFCVLTMRSVHGSNLNNGGDSWKGWCRCSYSISSIRAGENFFMERRAKNNTKDFLDGKNVFIFLTTDFGRLDLLSRLVEVSLR